MITFEAGTIIDGRYRLVRRIGRGGMGEVWHAHHRELRTHVAVKFIREKWFDDETIARRFVREARAAAQLHGQHVVQVLDHGRDGRLIYIVMELLRGQTLREYLYDHPGPAPPSVVRKIFDEITAPIAQAHRTGIVHRDLKPGNLFLAGAGARWLTKVMDFGLAKPVDPESTSHSVIETQHGVLLGTPAYMSPEGLQGHTIDHQTDLWALAVMVYELLCGERPFTGDSGLTLAVGMLTNARPVPSEHHPVPDGFDAWFARATHVDPTSRFQSVEAMSAELVALLKPVCDAPIPELPPVVELAEPGDAMLEDADPMAETIAGLPPASEGATLPGAGARPDGKRVTTRDVTPLRIAELNTQLQYRMVEQLQAAQKRAETLASQLSDGTAGDEDGEEAAD